MSNQEDTIAVGVKFLTIDPANEGQRVDNYLITKLKGVPKSRIYRILRKGEVRVNKGRVKPEYRLKGGDVVRIPPIRMSEKGDTVPPSAAILEHLNERIIYEDKGVLVLNKASGMAVHGGSGVNYGVIEALRRLRPEAPFLELVHRLDRDTSGCLLIAKRRSVLRFLHEQLREGSMDKEYLALVKGQWSKRKIVVNTPLKRYELQNGERMVRVDAEGKASESHFFLQQNFRNASLVRVALLTGRTHQIRVHACHSGHPLAGDPKYGDEQFNKEMRDMGMKRLFLHAEKLSFAVPYEEERITVTAPLGAELSSFLKKLEKM